MIEQVVSMSSGLDAGSSALFVQTASKFKSSVHVNIENKTVNAKSIMGIISLGIMDGQEITLIADGEDENQAVAELIRFLEKV